MEPINETAFTACGSAGRTALPRDLKRINQGSGFTWILLDLPGRVIEPMNDSGATFAAPPGPGRGTALIPAR